MVERWPDSVRVTDATLAGQRGRSVPTFTVSPVGVHLADREAWTGRVAAAMAEHGTYREARARAAELAASSGGRTEVWDGSVRAVDVDPDGW